MKAAPEDRLQPMTPRRGIPFVPVVIVLAALAVLAYYFWPESPSLPVAEAPGEAPVTARPAAPAEPPPAPDIPRRPPPPPATVDAAPPDTAVTEPALPTPEEADALLQEQMAAAGLDDTLQGMVGTEHPLEISAALLDGLGNGGLLRKLIPGNPQPGPFEAEVRDGQLYMSEAGYDRFDPFVQSLAATDTAQLASAFHTLRPVYERAWRGLGLDPEDFDNAVIRALDYVLATPELAEPPALARTSVMYTYLDPELESLPPLQKQLLRMGPDNVRLLKQKAAALRKALLAKPDL